MMDNVKLRWIDHLKSWLWLPSALIVCAMEMLSFPPRWTAVVEKELEGRK